MHQAQIHAESVLFVCPALSFVKSPLHFHHAALQGGHFVFWFRIPPGLNLSEIHARGRGGLQPGASIDSVPPWGPPQSRPRRWEFRTAKRESRPRHPDFFTAKRESRPRRPDFFAAKRESRQRRSPLPGRAFSAARPAGTARFLITRGKASFYETTTFGRRKVFFCSPFCGLLFCPARAKLALPAGGKPAARNPGRPAAARPTTATGSRFLRRQRERPPRRPRPSPPAREGSLGAPNDRTFPPGAERKARKEKGKEEPRMKRAPPL